MCPEEEENNGATPKRPKRVAATAAKTKKAKGKPKPKKK